MTTEIESVPYLLPYWVWDVDGQSLPGASAEHPEGFILSEVTRIFSKRSG
jgi:hypothetical protein